MSGELTEVQRAWLNSYREGEQNGRPYTVNSVWTRGTGNGHRGLASCRNAGLVTSTPDDSIHPKGWRHDITDAGRSLLEHTAEGE